MSVLEKIKKMNNIDDLEVFIKNIFEDEENEYIPAIINEGGYTSKEGEDFYLKLVIAHNKVNLLKTWLKENMSLGLIDPDWGNDDDLYQKLIENIITMRNVKGNSLYQINPLLVGVEVEELEYDNSTVVNALYKGGSGKSELILKSDGSKGLYILKKIIEPYLNETDSNIYPKYKLIAEYEYRTHDKKFRYQNVPEYKSKYGIHEISIDNKGMWLKGSIIIGRLKNESISGRAIDVVDMGSLEVRKHNPNNYDDDTQAGFVIFKKEVLDILKNDYYIYDLTIIEKDDIQNNIIIDILSDKVVFWEGEYNKFSDEMKNKIDSFNYIPEPIENIISPAMMAWQLEVDWNYHKKLFPNQMLANLIRKKYFNNAIDVGISFYEPNNIIEFREFILKLESITKITLGNFNPEIKDVKNLYNIYGKNEITLSESEIVELYQKYCYQIYKGIENE